MVILHYIPSIDTSSGGLGSYMQITTPELGKLVDLHVATHRTDDELPLENCTMHYISGMGINVSGSIKEEVWALIEEVHPDVVHVNCCWTPLCAYFTTWTREFCEHQCIKIPIIYTPHGMLEPWIIDHNYWTRKFPATVIYQRKAFKTADLIHSTADSEKSNLIKLGWNKKIDVIPNCVDVESIKIKESWKKTNNILFLSRVHPKKGINFIIEAATKLKDSMKGHRILIVGPGEESYVKSLKNQAERLGVQDIVIFEGPVFGDKKFDLYREADLFILPTHSENFGIVVAEALASGTPVITTVGTPWNELKDNNCGWWTEIGTQPLVDALKDFLSKDEDDLRTMGLNGRKLIEDKYSCKTIAHQFLEMYDRIVNKELTILHYIPRIDKRSGGLVSYMQLLSEELGQHCRLHVLTHKNKDNLKLENCTISYLSNMWPSTITKLEFKKVLDKIRPDIVHVNTCWLPLSAYTVMWAKEFGYKVVLTPHGMLDTLIIKHNYWTRKMPAIMYYQRKAVVRADIIHSTSKREKRILNHLGWNHNIHIIPNGVNTANIPHTSEIRKKKTILYLGRIHPQKGINHLIEAVAQLKQELRSERYKVEIVGMGEEGYIDKLKSQYSELGLKDLITIQEAAFEEVKWKLFREASVFVLPSFSESFGIVVAEALANGTPVITTMGTPWEEIEGTENPDTHEVEGKCGWWIESGTAPLVDALRQFLATSESELQTMSKNGQKLITERYSSKNVVKEFITMYNNLRKWEK